MSEKSKKIFVCSKCDAQFPKWFGQCPECGNWGSLQEQEVTAENKKVKTEAKEIIAFNQIKAENFLRIRTGIEEFDRVLGGGIVPGSLVLLGGEPGIGKSTLVLQIAEKITNFQPPPSKQVQNSVLYISGEESAEQVKMRVDRLGIRTKNLQFLGETDIETIIATLEKYKPQAAIIDSIQTLSFADLPSEAGSVSQIRAAAAKILEVAKKNKIAIFIIGHVTKEGTVAGPKTLEHIVDTVLYLEGDPYHHFRLLRAVKNRFGATGEVGVFDMKENGLVEVKNPSEAFLSERVENIPGSVVSVVVKGTRSFLVEVQALVNPTNFGYSQRRARGFDVNRLPLLLAVLARRVNINLNNFDVHLNIAGGLWVDEPAIDLAVCLAIVSAYKNRPCHSRMAVFGEVGLAGEIRPVAEPEKRIKEAEKLGFEKILLPRLKTVLKSKIQLQVVRDLNEAIVLCLKN
jgi:DNA repair protein RadA/Sms